MWGTEPWAALHCAVEISRTPSAPRHFSQPFMRDKLAPIARLPEAGPLLCNARMERLLPAEAVEPGIPQRPSVLRTTLYGLLTALLIGGAWVRFNDQIAGFAPSLAGPAAGVAAQLADAGRETRLLEIALLPVAQTSAAVANMALPAADADALAQDVRRGRLRLVQLPLLDINAADPAAGQNLEVSSGGYTRLVHLGPQPLAVTLPISSVGTVSFRSPAGAASGLVALTLTGPVPLPYMKAGQRLDVGVIAQ